jgi:hypothetical protein
MKNRFSSKIIWLVIVLCLILAIPVFHIGYEAFNNPVVAANRIQNNRGFLGATGPRR